MATVAQVIAAAKILIRRPSVLKMPDEDWRLLLHRKLEYLNALAIEENGDFYTHEKEVSLTYSATHKGFTYDITGIDESLYRVYPVMLMQQDETADADTSDWYAIRIVKYAQFQAQGRTGRTVACFTGNTFDGSSGVELIRMNVTSDWASTRRFRMGFRLFPVDILGYADNVPFPREHIGLLEVLLAQAALPLVRDDSEDWRGFVSMVTPTLQLDGMQRQQAFLDWVNKDTDNVYVTEQPYHYRLNNQLRRVDRSVRVDD